MCARLTCLVILFLSSCLPVASQDGSLFHADASLALTSFRVQHGDRYLQGLTAHDIRLLEDGVERPITLFQSRATSSTVPLDLILLFDISDSVSAGDLLNPGLIEARLLPALSNLRVAVYAFNSNLYRLSIPTHDGAQLAVAFESLKHPDRPIQADILPLTIQAPRVALSGETWIYEAVAGAARDVAGKLEDTTRMMLVISDGLATTTTTPGDAAGVCKELGIAVYPVALGRDRYRSNSRQWNLSQDFLSLARLTGGEAFDNGLSPSFVQQLLDELVRQMHAEYVVGFDPAPSTPPARHRIEVRLANEKAGNVVGGSRIL